MSRVLSAIVLLCAGLLTVVGSPPLADAAAQRRTIQTPHYQVETDFDETLAADMTRRLEVLHSEYTRRLSIFSAEAAAVQHKVVLLRKQADVQRLTGLPPGAAGGFQPATNLLAAFLERQGREELRKTIQHEAFHQFAHNAISKEMPVWLNEGLAVYFEEGIWTGEGFLLGQVPPHRVRSLKSALDNQRMIRFQKLMKMSLEEWGQNVATDEVITEVQYNQSWAMVHFLVHGSNGDDAFRPRFIRMLELLHEGKSGDEAFAEAFSSNLEGFQNRFIEYLAQLTPTPEATMVERQTILGSLLIFLDREGRRINNIADFRQAVIDGGYRRQIRIGEQKWESELGERYFQDRNGRYFTDRFLYLDSRLGAPLPDIVCRSGSLQFRTRFYRTDDETDYDVVIESR